MIVETRFLQKILACPVCKTPFAKIDSGTSLCCGNCQTTFVKGTFVWNLIPPNVIDSTPLWGTWQQLQSNSIAGYKADPERNLSIGNRDDCKQFAQFCNYQDLVLDVGCGPQSWPAYFDRSSNATFVGIDPLAEDTPNEFLKFMALAEFLPFQDNTFDQVLFSTTLDHFVDPKNALQEAVRISKADGEINIWLGEKRPDAPKPTVSPEWYRNLKKPKLADDLFHVKRLVAEDMETLASAVGLTIYDHEEHKVDNYRANHFFKLTL